CVAVVALCQSSRKDDENTETGGENGKDNRQDHLGTDPADAARLRRVDEVRGARIADTGNDDEADADEKQCNTIIAAEWPGKPGEEKLLRCRIAGRAGKRVHDELELLDQETESDDRKPCPGPGEEGAFVGGMVREIADHSSATGKVKPKVMPPSE